MTVIRGRVESVFSQSQLGGFAGGGAEKTPAGDYSTNTLEWLVRYCHLSGALSPQLTSDRMCTPDRVTKADTNEEWFVVIETHGLEEISEI
jgi:hypothetical protein